MRTICLYFQIHQPFRLRRYRFFDIGNEHYYYDDYSNEAILQKVATRSYIKANEVLLDIIKKHKDRFKVTFSISGPALDQFELYAPEVLASFKKLAKTGQVEFLCETNSHSLVSLTNPEEFEKQVNAHRTKIWKYFEYNPMIFSNTELIYSDQIGAQIADMGFEGIITEGAKQILGWKSPNYLYCNAINPRLKVLLRNFKLSDDLSFRFSNRSWNEYPLTTEKYAHWLNSIDKKEENVNIFFDYETIGGRQPAESGIFNFLRHLPEAIFKYTDYSFSTPSEVVKILQPVAPVSVPYAISWADEERDITAWLGNDLQKEAFLKLYQLTEQVYNCADPTIQIDWNYLQSSDHFYYMSTKFFSDRTTYSYVNPFDSPYDAFINYMNVLSDFTLRIKKITAANGRSQDVSELLKLIDQQEKIITQYEIELEKVHLQEKTITPKAKNSTTKKPAKTAGKKVTDKPKGEKKKELSNVQIV
jgi:alpha-amylase